MSKNLAKQIKSFRMANEITQPECAVLLGVSEPTLQRLETGSVGSDLTRAKVLNRLRDSTNSMIYRQRGVIVDENVSVQVIRSHAKTAIKFAKKKGKPSPVPAPEAREELSDAG